MVKRRKKFYCGYRWSRKLVARLRLSGVESRAVEMKTKTQARGVGLQTVKPLCEEEATANTRKGTMKVRAQDCNRDPIP